MRLLPTLLLLAACAPVPEGRNLVLITLDTTRPDHLSCYGWLAPTSRTLDAIAARGVLFENAYAPMPQTLPSHATLFTGAEPRDHGALENAFVLPEDVETIAETLADRGYETAAFIGARVLTAHRGTAQGFDVFDEPTGPALSPQHPPERQAHEVTDAVLAWLRKRDRDRPLFLWVHYYDPHGPYIAPPHKLVQRGIEKQPIVEHVAAQPQFEGGVGILSERDIGLLWHAYDSEIAFTDGELERLLAGLAEDGVMDDAALAIVGDHGEGLGEHNEKGHGVNVYEEQMRIPLILKTSDDALAGTRVRAQVPLRRVHPTLLELALGTSEPGGLWSPLLAGREPRGEPVFVERPHYTEERADWRHLPDEKRGELVGVVDGRWKLIRVQGEDRLYDLQSDPEELAHVNDRHPDQVARLAAQLDAWLEAHPVDESAVPQLTEEHKEVLRELGYLGDDG